MRFHKPSSCFQLSDIIMHVTTDTPHHL